MRREPSRPRLRPMNQTPSPRPPRRGRRRRQGSASWVHSSDSVERDTLHSDGSDPVDRMMSNGRPSHNSPPLGRQSARLHQTNRIPPSATTRCRCSGLRSDDRPDRGCSPAMDGSVVWVVFPPRTFAPLIGATESLPLPRIFPVSSRRRLVLKSPSHLLPVERVQDDGEAEGNEDRLDDVHRHEFPAK